ncbi:hypothetical protein PTKIN_Ptkin13bG0194900 [Pterospermum kingtungense]
METILQEHHNQMPVREMLIGLADKFSESEERKGKIVVQFKQVWNWFQNRRYAIRAKSSKVPGKLSITSVPGDDTNPVRNVPQPVAAPMPSPMTAAVSAAMPASTGENFLGLGIFFACTHHPPSAAVHMLPLKLEVLQEYRPLACSFFAHEIIHSTRLGIVNAASIKLDCRKYYSYVASLTVPPYTEGVVWTIIKKSVKD